MSDIVERLREAHPNSAQRFAGSNILLDAAAEIERLEKERAYAIRWANKAVEDVKASYEAELANIDARASEAADAVGVTPHSDIRLFVEQAVKYALNAALKAEGESR